MYCTKCEHYISENRDKMEHFNCHSDVCCNCKVLFPWLEESQFKAKETCIKCKQYKELGDLIYCPSCGKEL